MQEQSRYVVGIDVGTSTVRCVVGHTDPTTGAPSIVGVGQAPNSGMRKGVVSDLHGPSAAIDACLEEAERMSGHQVDAAALSINGAHIISTRADGMIAVGTHGQEVQPEDIARLEDVAATGKVPANREILEVVPHTFRLDGQEGMKDPVGMTGTRLEIVAHIVSALSPHMANLQKAAQMAKVEPTTILPSVLASAQAVLTEAQRENGVAVLDMGATTTGVAVYEEGDLQYVAVIPVGGQQITNDLAIGLKTDPEVAEEVKLQHGRLMASGGDMVTVKHHKVAYQFAQAEIDEIIEARCEELFEAVAKELKKAGRAGKLPSGIVLAGAAAQLRGVVAYAKQQLGVAVKLGMPTGYAGVSDQVEGSAYAAAVGLMLADTVRESRTATGGAAGQAVKKAGGWLSSLFARWK